MSKQEFYCAPDCSTVHLNPVKLVCESTSQFSTEKYQEDGNIYEW